MFDTMELHNLIFHEDNRRAIFTQTWSAGTMSEVGAPIRRLSGFTRDSDLGPAQLHAVYLTATSQQDAAFDTRRISAVLARDSDRQSQRTSEFNLLLSAKTYGGAGSLILDHLAEWCSHGHLLQEIVDSEPLYMKYVLDSDLITDVLSIIVAGAEITACYRASRLDMSITF